MKISGLFVTGTDTGVGKTYVASAIVRALRSQGIRVGAYKPAASGCFETGTGGVAWEDVETLWSAVGEIFRRDRICPQTFRAPLAPPVAARAERRRVDDARLRAGAVWWESVVDFLVVEGAGGLLAPLSDNQSNADLARELELPLLIVARLGLGTLNHTLLTLEVAAARGIPVVGVILTQAAPDSDPSCETNPEELAARTSVPILGVFPHAPGIDLATQPAFAGIDWRKLVATE